MKLDSRLPLLKPISAILFAPSSYPYLEVHNIIIYLEKPEQD